MNFNISWFGFLTILASVLISSVSWDVFYYKFDVPKWIVLDLFICTVLTYAFIKKVDIEIGRVGWLCAALLVSMLASLIHAVNPYEGVVFILRYLGSTLLCCIMLKSIWHRYGVTLLFDAVICSSAIFSLIYIESRVNDYDLIHTTAFSTFGFVNNLGQVLNIWLPVLVAAILYQGKLNTRSVCGFLSFITCICALLESGTRGTILGLLLGETMLFLLILGKLRRKALIYLTITISLIAGSIVYSQVDSYLGARLNGKLQTIKALDTGREELFVNSFDMLLDNPFGVGANNFEYLHPKYAKLGSIDATPMVGENLVLTTPHNIALKFFSETGWLGGMIFCAILTLIVFKSIVNAYKGNQTDRWLLVATISTLFHSMFTALFLTPGSLFFAILMFSFVLYRNKELTEENTMARKVIRFRYLPALVIVYAGVFTSNHLASYYAHHGYVSGNQLYMQRGLKLNPYNSKALYDYYILQRYLYKDNKQALGALEKFLPLYPYHTSGLLAAAELMIQHHNYTGALEQLDFLLAFYPNLARAYELKMDAQKKLESRLVL
ncbi:O-antigen ligase family protein [Pseudoalteromonas viridis]|uniref:O-antigen ligase family protein n=1 Tax=Pseudoalteromonas viridis TaxID=339617 RepID=A0ABX7VCH7_9GAMM|nr:O-antigen ligase family protein [Pseudoalteromonas viridis]QTL37467.1 O-antigen ligase family protein [Pseudoalteromonas viridis]